MNNIVLDTNSLVQIISRKSPYRDIWLSVRDGRSFLCVTNEILEEYEEVLTRLMGTLTAKTAIEFMLNNPYTKFIIPYYRFELIKADPDDNKFVDCAISANAKFIVTEDNHFNILKQIDFPKVDIIDLDNYLRYLNNH